MKILIETWDPEYGSPILEAELEPSDVSINMEVEKEANSWTPISADQGMDRIGTVYFVDGVRRLEALVWLQEEGQIPRRGLCASIAAGVVKSSDHAKITNTIVRRILVSSLSIPALPTKAGVFEPVLASGPELKDLLSRVQEGMRSIEAEVSSVLVSEENALVIVDGPLSGHKIVPHAVGYIKTHQVAYLPELQSRVLGDLKPGQRSPIFQITKSWTRYSWYLRLPGPLGHPLSGVVRLEAAGELEFSTVQQLAGLTSAMLPHFSSQPHKDPRAPQNLFPIGGLERDLRRRLGDREIVIRALKIATLSTQ